MEFDFQENAVVKAEDFAAGKVPEQFKALYAEDAATKTFKLKAEDPAVKGSVEAIVGFNKALKAERAVTKDLRARTVDLAPLKDFGATPEEIAANIQAKMDDLQGKKFDVEKVKQDIAKGYVGEIQKRDTQVGVLRKQLETIMVDEAIRRSLGDKAVDPDLVLPFVKNNVKVIDDNGNLAVRVVDDSGNQRFSGVTAGPLSINEYIEEMKGGQKYAPLFKAPSKSGSGASPSATATRTPADQRKLSAMEKISRGLDARAR